MDLQIEHAGTRVIIHAPNDEDYTFVKDGEGMKLASSPRHNQRSPGEMQQIYRLARSELFKGGRP